MPKAKKVEVEVKEPVMEVDGICDWDGAPIKHKLEFCSEECKQKWIAKNIE